MILVISNRWAPEYTGVGQRIQNLYQLLDLEYVVISGYHQTKKTVQEPRCFYVKKFNLELSGKKYIRLFTWLFRHLFCFISLPLIMLRIRVINKVTCIHVLRGGGLIHAMGVFWGKCFFPNAKVVVECAGGDGYDQLVKTGRGMLKSSFGEQLFTYCVRVADDIICSGNHLLNQFKNKPIRANIKVRTPFYDPEIFKPVTLEQKIKLKSKYSIPQNRTVLVTIGMVNALKNQCLIAQALNKIDPETYYWIVIGTDTDDKDYLNKLSRSISPESFEYHNTWTDFTQEWYQMADYYLFASTREGMNNSINESLMCGVPVIALENGCYDHLNSFKDSGFFMSFDYNSYLKELGAFLNRDYVKKKCANLAREVFNKKDLFNSYSNLCK